MNSDSEQSELLTIFVGLGNPGNAYQFTRHNAGAIVLENLAKIKQCPALTENKKVHSELCKHQNIIYAKPTTFMNNSGQAVRAVIDYYLNESEKSNQEKNVAGYRNLYVIHDDLDLALGSYKIQYGIGPKVHNGLLSIYQHLGTKNFWHVRVGVDSRGENRTIPAQNYVLQRFSPQEMDTFNESKIELVKEILNKLE
jgi:peptidyl-tRNA hydrolase, PTH1 family